jgi:hypothetical protein
MSSPPEEINEIELDVRKRSFIARVNERHSVGMHLFILFFSMWLFAWGVSAVLLAFGLISMPLRYAFAFASSYCFFYALVEFWIRNTNWLTAPVQKEGESNWNGLPSDVPDMGEGCLVVLLISVIALLFTGLVAMMGGFSFLLEVVFEALFAGVVVRTLKGSVKLGDWKLKLFQLTWLPALIVLILLCSIAWSIQTAHPQARTIQEVWSTASKPNHR